MCTKGKKNNSKEAIQCPVVETCPHKLYIVMVMSKQLNVVENVFKFASVCVSFPSAHRDATEDTLMTEPALFGRSLGYRGVSCAIQLKLLQAE